MSHSFINYPSTGPDQGIVQDLSPAASSGTAAEAITGSLKRLYNRVERHMPLGSIWVDDPSISANLRLYVDSADLALGAAVTSWTDRTGAFTLTQATSARQMNVVIGRTGKVAARANIMSNSTAQTVATTTPVLDTSSQWTVIYVLDQFQYNNPGLLGIATVRTSQGIVLLRTGGGGTPGMFSTSFTPASPRRYMPDGMTVIVLACDGTQIKEWVNGQYHGTNTLHNYNVAYSGLEIGQSNGDGIAADWYLHAAYNACLSDVNIAKLNTALVAAYVPSIVFDPSSDMVVFDGDSRMWGGNAAYSGGALAHQTMALLGRNLPYFNVAGPGARTSTPSSGVQLQPYASNVRRKGVAVMLCGINDMYDGASGASVFANLQTWSTNARAKGLKTIVCTVYGSNGLDSTKNTNLSNLNGLIAGDPSSFDAKVDLSALSGLMSGTSINASYSADGLHLNAAGNRLCGTAISTVLKALLDAA